MSNNPSAPGGHTARFGPVTANQYRPFLDSVVINANMSEPSTVNACELVGVHAKVAFLVIPPPGVTGYDIVYGRWVQDERNALLGGSEGINRFIKVGLEAVLVADFPEKEIVFDTYTDPVAIYITGIDGSPDPDTTFRIFYRGA